MKATALFLVLAAFAAACSSNRPAADTARTSPPVAAPTPGGALASAAVPGSAVASSSTAVSAPAAALVSAQDGVDPELVRQGYHAAQRHGQVVYCKEQPVTGSRFTTNVCLSAEQLKDREQRMREEMQRMHQSGCTGSAGCGN